MLAKDHTQDAMLCPVLIQNGYTREEKHESRDITKGHGQRDRSSFCVLRHSPPLYRGTTQYASTREHNSPDFPEWHAHHSGVLVCVLRLCTEALQNSSSSAERCRANTPPLYRRTPQAHPAAQNGDGPALLSLVESYYYTPILPLILLSAGHEHHSRVPACALRLCTEAPRQRIQQCREVAGQQSVFVQQHCETSSSSAKRSQANTNLTTLIPLLHSHTAPLPTRCPTTLISLL